MKIFGATIENFKRIVVAQIDSDGKPAVEITGANEQGKSSILDSIEAALGGKRRQPTEPIRRGAERARVVVDLGELIVERVWTAKSDRLVVKAKKDGASYPRAQEKLDGLVSGLAFDPLEFLELNPAEQRGTLLTVLGVDLDGFEARHAEAYDKRREVNRDLKTAQAQLDGVEPVPKDTPEEELLIADLVEKVERLSSKAAGHENKRRELERAREEEARLQRLLEDATKARKALEEEVASFKAPNVDAAREELRNAEDTNRLVRRRQQRAELEKRAAKLRSESEALTERLAEIAKEKEDALTKAPMPVEGLAVTDDGVTYEGLPFSQAAMSRRVRVCTAIMAALKPELRIALIRHGNDLDSDNLAAFYEACKEADIQPWVERRDGITEDALVIEAGRIQGADGGDEQTEIKESSK